MKNEMEKTMALIAAPGRGILAADESKATITKRFEALHIECTEENRRRYRELFFLSPDANKYINGVILFEETLSQSAHTGQTFADLLKSLGIAVGIKVDKGPIEMPFYPGEKVTQGLDGLKERLEGYKAQGAQFAKWRAVIDVSPAAALPTCHAVHVNADVLARYAAICQSVGIVPIVEPEVLMDGDHDMATAERVTTMALQIVFEKLHYYRVSLEHIILKPNMVVPGAKAAVQASVKEVAEATVRTLKRTVPAAVRTINFLSGGQSDELASEHLSAMNALGPLPWNLSFSYGRALQSAAMKTWVGKPENVSKAQQVFLKRAKLNALASLGKYTRDME